MNLSRRSLGLSVLLHCSLVGGGYLWWTQGASSRPLVRQEGARSVTVVTRPVTVKPKLRVLPEKAFEPISTPSGRAAVAVPEEVAKQPRAAVQGKVAPPSSTVADTPTSRPLSSGPVYPKASPAKKIPIQRPSKRESPVPAPPSPKPAPVGWGVQRPQAPPPAGEEGPQSTVTRRAMPTAQPEFRLQERFPQLASVTVKAQFKVAPDGTYEPTLLTSSGDPTADVVILGKLLDFTWLPAMKKGVPYEDTRVLDISLEL